MGTSCPSGVFPQLEKPSYYRYFNQPVEQIPGWNLLKDQVLGHGKNFGLQWLTANNCISAATCITFTSGNLIAQRKKIPIFAEFNIVDCSIGLDDCSCCQWNGVGTIFFSIVCNNALTWKTAPVTFTKLSNYVWEYNGTLPDCGNEKLHCIITCNGNVSINNCQAKWTYDVIRYPCLDGPLTTTYITPNNINTFGFPPEIIENITSSPYWPDLCECDSPPPFFHVQGNVVNNCGCCS